MSASDAESVASFQETTDHVLIRCLSPTKYSPHRDKIYSLGNKWEVQRTPGKELVTSNENVSTL